MAQRCWRFDRYRDMAREFRGVDVRASSRTVAVPVSCAPIAQTLLNSHRLSEIWTNVRLMHDHSAITSINTLQAACLHGARVLDIKR